MKKNAKVRYQTPRGKQRGEGKIVDIIESGRGLWYEVKDALSGKLIRLRAACISPI